MDDAIFVIIPRFGKDNRLIGCECRMNKDIKLLDIVANTIVNAMKVRPDFEKAMLDNLAEIYKNGRKDC